MKVQLNYQPQAQGQAQAAFLRGGGIMDWLPEMERWGVAVERLKCFVVPQSLADRSPAGLLVIFPDNKIDLQNGAAIPCYLLANRLVLPLQAELTPVISAAELDRLLLFPLQFLHPSLGMVGWEANEQLDFGKLLEAGAEKSRAWDLAHPGNAPMPPLHDAKVPQPTMEEALAQLMDGIDPQPLSDLADKKKPEEDDSPFGRFMAGLFKGGLSMTNGIMDQLPTGEGPPGEGFMALSKLAGWLAGKAGGGVGGGSGGGRESLEGQRDSALDKLLDMFDNDFEQALRYAIPLDDPYQKRGMGSAGGSLSEKDARFNLGRIGGGVGGNTWNIEPNRYQILRERYLKAANEAIARGDFEKAAYIYAHLLHDLNGAANVLQQGKMYREAAAIYKEHLKNLDKAAECLEKGGLILDAIDLYIELQRWEKAGDLYATIGNKAKAELQYERCVDAAMAKGDYLEACRFMQEKLGQQDRALVTMLQGWHDNKQDVACLRRYLQTVCRLPEIDMAQQLEMLYTQHTPETKQSAFLSTVVVNLDLLETDEARAKARSIAYEILSSKSARGDNNQLGLLHHLIPEDNMVGSDVSRFNSGLKQPGKEPVKVPQLNKNIEWLGCKTLGVQMLAYGREGNHLWLARFNFQGNVEYYHWPEHLEQGVDITLITPRGHDGAAYLYAGEQATFSKKFLPINERFSTALEVSSPNWLQDDFNQLLGICLRSGGDISTLVTGGSYTTLKRYSAAGELRSEMHLKTPEGGFFQMHSDAEFQPVCEVSGNLVTFEYETLLLIDSQGIVQTFPAADVIQGISLSHASSSRSLCAISTHSQAWHLLDLTAPFQLQTLKLSGSIIGEMCFLPGNLFAMTVSDRHAPDSNDQVLVYAVGGETPTLEMKVDLDFKPVAIIVGPRRGSFCLIGKDGKVVAYEVEDKLDDWN